MQVEAEADLRLREMTPQDLPGAHALSREAKWPHRVEDWELMLRLGEGIVAEADGKVVGTIMGWAHGPEAATLGMVIVSGERRGAGLGRRLMQAMIERLEPRAIQLNATPEGLPLYKSLGFAPIGSIHQHQGAAFQPPMPKLRPGERVRPLGATDHPVLLELDAAATGFHRPQLLKALAKRGHGVVLDRGGEADGFALVRRFGHGYAIGPVVAPDREAARTLIGHWLGAQAGRFIRIDVPGDSGLVDWLEELGVDPVDRVITMRRGAEPARAGGVAAWAVISQAYG